VNSTLDSVSPDHLIDRNSSNISILS